MDKLTQKQQKVLDYIKNFYMDNCVMPTIREIAAQFKITIAPVQNYLQVLEKKGYLNKKNSLSRGIEFTNMSKFRPVPILGGVHAGTFLEPVENAQDYVYI
ncbi:MAG: winged helix-turn-helix transcriptional regulator, partial [Elusimicrobiota bacterium]|nr:winged helix-turn-helix transcriptional regulator [Elusimicrobiota bacterium]